MQQIWHRMQIVMLVHCLPIKVMSMACVWKTTTKCSSCPFDVLALPCFAKMIWLTLAEMRIMSENSALMLQQPRRCCHSWNQWWQIHGNSPLWRLRVLQTDMTSQVCKAPQCCVTSGSLLRGKAAGSHWWIYFVVFLGEGVCSHQTAGTSPSMFSYTDVSKPAFSWLVEVHLCNLEMTLNHKIPFASINHWAKWRQGTGEKWVCDQVEV